MSIYKITYSSGYRRANLHNFGCNLNCRWCSYRLNGRERPREFLDIDRIMETLHSLDLKRVHLLGGEPTTYPGLAELVDRIKGDLDVVVKIGHSNGTGLPPPGVDEANVSIKSLDDEVCRTHLGVPIEMILENFQAAYDMGIMMDASSVLIPGLVGVEDIGRIADSLADIDDRIPYHVIGYIPVPGAPWRAPSDREVEAARERAARSLRSVTSSAWSPEELERPWIRDPRYDSVRVA
ncbi:MAG: radical SAM protein [Methanomassiliicoccales archaeon]